MSAAAARRRKQLEKKRAQEAQGDPVLNRLSKLLEGSHEEATAYEGLQLAQSLVRKHVKSGEYANATKLAYDTSLTLLQKGRVSVASQLIAVFIDVLSETHTECTDDWITNLRTLDTTYRKSLDENVKADDSEHKRLGKLHLDILRRALRWSNDMGSIRYGHFALHDLVGEQCWRLSKTASDADDNEEQGAVSAMSLMSDAMTHFVMGEKPETIVEKLKELPAPTDEELQTGRTVPAADRDSLLTRAVLLFISLENIRDGNKLLRAFIEKVETRESSFLTTSYMDKKDGLAPAHCIFCSMLLRICEKETRTGPLFSWLLRSFKAELEMMYKAKEIQTYTTKIGKIYFEIEPPPSMMSMMEKMMGSLGGGGAPAIDPALMQAAMQQVAGGQQ